ncbi:SixA phosphatase family protein [Lentzea kentuckyensis]|uniref:SixA phosphatase family protein n=1 Tax=Lentzea kentuckyensis TaxID=360086 RepID=UPI000A3B9D38|nr:phosphoglycerate mutase family protein [Lentzea kentuckyensis]
MTTVLLVRHADIDLPPEPGEPSLNELGRRRAELLARIVAEAGVTAIVTSDRRRTKQTAQPLASRTQLQPVVAGPDLADRIRAGSLGDVVLVVGHSNTVPPLVQELGGTPSPIGEREFDNLFVVTVDAGGVRLKYGEREP